MPPGIRTNLSTITWSVDGQRVTKAYDMVVAADAFRPRADILRHHGRPSPAIQFAYELRVNQLLCRHPPPVPAPRLVGHDRARATLSFEAVDGAPFGPKYPLELEDADLGSLIALALATCAYKHRPRWLRRLPIQNRLRASMDLGLLTRSEYAGVRQHMESIDIRWVFAHGDVTPRNVLRTRNGPVLIDWEWAGVYPSGYELAFLWFVLADLPHARRIVEREVGAGDAGFWLSALVIQLLHLPWSPAQFRDRHTRTRDELVARLLS